MQLNILIVHNCNPSKQSNKIQNILNFDRIYFYSKVMVNRTGLCQSMQICEETFFVVLNIYEKIFLINSHISTRFFNYRKFYPV